MLVKLTKFNFSNLGSPVWLK